MADKTITQLPQGILEDNTSFAVEGTTTTNSVSIQRLYNDFEARLRADSTSRVGTIVVMPFKDDVEALKRGLLPANGGVYNRDAYPALFAVIGTTYGTTGATSFAVPDYRDRHLRGIKLGSILENVGDTVEDGVKEHTHDADDHTHNADHNHTASQADHRHDPILDGYVYHNASAGAHWLGSSGAVRVTASPAAKGATPYPNVITVNTANLTTSSFKVNINLTGNPENTVKAMGVKFYIVAVDGLDLTVTLPQDATDISFNNIGTDFAGAEVQAVLVETDARLNALTTAISSEVHIEGDGAVHTIDLSAYTTLTHVNICMSSSGGGGGGAGEVTAGDGISAGDAIIQGDYGVGDIPVAIAYGGSGGLGDSPNATNSDGANPVAPFVDNVYATLLYYTSGSDGGKSGYVVGGVSRTYGGIEGASGSRLSVNVEIPANKILKITIPSGGAGGIGESTGGFGYDGYAIVRRPVADG